MKLAFAIITILASTTVPANAYTARNKLPVADIGAAVFEVVARGGKVGARDYWCAAGDYAFSLGNRSNARIYLVQGPGPSSSMPGRKSVRFTMDAQSADVIPIEPLASLSVDSPGDNMSVTVARQYCWRSFTKS